MKKLIIVFCVLLSVIIVVLTLFKVRHHHNFVDVDDSTRQTYINHLNEQVISDNAVEYTITKPEVRRLLEEMLGFRHYFYKEDSRTNGGYAVVFYRYINVNADLNIEQYCAVICHEMCHIKHFTANEIYTNFMAFKTLYESDNAELKQAGTWFGIHILNGEYDNNYDCSSLIIDYLNKKY